jgi:DNA-binding MarR family transcriptional regulator
MAAGRRRGELSGAHAYAGLDRVLHEKARLGILTALLAHADGTLFPELKELCDLTDGNLARHLQVLHEAGLVEIFKNTEGPRSKTLIRLSRRGREAFLAYLEELERVVREAKAQGAAARRARGSEPPPGFVPV